MRTLLTSEPLQVGTILIVGEEAHHGRTVLRLRIGDNIRLADGCGHEAIGVVSVIERTSLSIVVTEVTTLCMDPAHYLTVVVAPPKGDRLADVVRGLTELGVGKIQLLACERGERIPGKLDRLQRVAAEALKQCRRSHLPEIAESTSIERLAAGGGELMILDRTGGAPAFAQPRPISLIIGPEGGLTESEVATLQAVGAVAVRIAGPILRIETAALAAAALWASAWEHVST